MATKKGKGNPPAPMDPKVVKKMLDLLSTDNEYRRLFKKDTSAALLKAGYKPPTTPPFPVPGPPPSVPVAGPQACGMLMVGDRIAPKEKIIRERAKIEQALALPFTFNCMASLQAD